MLEELTKKHEAMLDKVADDYIALLQRGDEIDLAAAKPALEMIYGFYDLKLPEKIEICDSMEAAYFRAKELGISDPIYDLCSIYDADWSAHYELFALIHSDKNPTLNKEEAEDLRKLRNMLFAGIYETILLDECALLIRFPCTVKTNARGDLHCENGPAFGWRDGWREFAWNGVFVPQKLIESPETYSKKEALELPTEQRRAFCERFGWSNALALFECYLRDSWSDPKTGLRYELYSGPDDAILKKQSPRLKTGEQPHYCEPVHRDLKTAQAARKWQAVMRPGKDPRLVADECNLNPGLSYGVEA